MIPARGAVLGLDVGFSAAGRTTGLCALTWDEDALTWQAAVTGTGDDVRTAALRQLLKPEPYAPDLPPLPTFRGGRELVDVSDREALYRVFDQD